MARVFKLSDIELERGEKFERFHSNHGETVSYIFVCPKNQTDNVIKVRCNSCGRTENITDFK